MYVCVCAYIVYIVVGKQQLILYYNKTDITIKDKHKTFKHHSHNNF